jgi:tetratricopeptide (TPR) repeat protein
MVREKTPNLKIRAVREERFMMSRPEFASLINQRGIRMGENTGCTSRVIATWEDGEVACPRPIYRRILTELTGESLAELGFSSGAPPAGRTVIVLDQLNDQEQPVDRRSFLSGLATLGFDPERGTPRKIGTAEVRTVRKMVHQLKQLDERMGGDNLSMDAHRALAALNRLINTARYTETTGRHLRSAYGDLAVLTGWLSYDANRPQDAWGFYNQSLYQARMADDPEVEVHAYAQMSMAALKNGMPRDAVELARMGQRISARHVPPRVMSLLALREACGWAQLVATKETRTALSRAYKSFDNGPSDEDPRWIDFYSLAELDGLAATCHADLGDTDVAMRMTEKTLATMDHKYGRNRAWYSVVLAETHLRQGDMYDACEVARDTLPLIAEVSSTRTRARLGAFRKNMEQYKDEPAVRDFLAESRDLVA